MNHTWLPSHFFRRHEPRAASSRPNVRNTYVWEHQAGQGAHQAGLATSYKYTTHDSSSARSQVPRSKSESKTGGHSSFSEVKIRDPPGSVPGPPTIMSHPSPVLGVTESGPKARPANTKGAAGSSGTPAILTESQDRKRARTQTQARHVENKCGPAYIVAVNGSRQICLRAPLAHLISRTRTPRRPFIPSCHTGSQFLQN